MSDAYTRLFGDEGVYAFFCYTRYEIKKQFVLRIITAGAPVLIDRCAFLA